MHPWLLPTERAPRLAGAFLVTWLPWWLGLCCSAHLGLDGADLLDGLHAANSDMLVYQYRLLIVVLDIRCDNAIIIIITATITTTNLTITTTTITTIIIILGRSGLTDFVHCPLKL